MSDSPDSLDRESLLDLVLDEAAERARRGESPEVEEFVARFPALAAELREMLPALFGLQTHSTIPRRLSSSPTPGFSLDDGQTLGDYRIRRELGRGGMGIVYEAEQLSLGRSVALKLLSGGARRLESLGRRFELEARTAARLQHPHIVAVHDFGQTDDFAFYAMEYIDGVDLDSVVSALRRSSPRDAGAVPPEEGLATSLAVALRTGAIDGRSSRASGSSSGAPHSSTAASTPDHEHDDGPTPPGQRPGGESGSARLVESGTRYFTSVARIGALVADALSHAHGAGIVHRDIKPSNLLLDRQGKVWVADFGLAKLDEGEGLTRSGDAVGTLRYMGPERFRGWSDARSDVYSLGATLYELVTLGPPFDERDRANLVQKISSDAPVDPRRIDPRIPRDLETVILKCLEKEPAQRYSGAAELRDELERFIEGRPLLARRASAAERAWLFARRNPIVSSLAAALFIVAVVATVSALQLSDTASELDRRLVEAHIANARARLGDADPGARGEMLGRIAEAARRHSSLELRDAAIPWIGGVGFELERRIAMAGRLEPAALAPAGDRIALANGEAIAVYPIPNSERSVARDLALTRALRFEGCQAAIPWDRGFDYSPDGKYLVRRSRRNRTTEILSAYDGECLLLVRGQWAFHSDLSFHPRARRVAVMFDGRFTIFDLSTGEALTTPTWASDAEGLFYGPNGKLAATIQLGGRALEIFDLASGRRLHRFVHPKSDRGLTALSAVAWHPEGRFVATRGRPIVVWDLEFEGSMFVDSTHNVVSVAFSPDGTLLATGSWSGSRLWDVYGGELLARFRGMFKGFRADSRALFTREDAEIRIARIDRNDSHRVFAVADWSPLGIRKVAFAPAGRWLGMGRESGVHFWDVRRQSRGPRLDCGHTSWLGWRRDASALVTAGPGGTWLWPWRSGDDVLAVGPPERVDATPALNGAIGPDDLVVILRSRDLLVRRLDSPGQGFVLPRRSEDADNPCVSADGRFLALAGSQSGKEALVWDLASREVVWREKNVGAARAFFLGDDHLYVGTTARQRVFELGSWRKVYDESRDFRIAATSADGLTCATFSASAPFRTRLQTFVGDGVPGFQTLTTLENAIPLALGPRGLAIALGEIGVDGLHVWRLDSLRPRLRAMGLDWDPPLSEESPTERMAALRIEIDLGLLDPDPQRVTEFAGRALDVRPGDHGARVRRARAARSLGRWELAFTDYEHALRDATSWTLLDEVAWLYATAPQEHRDMDRAQELARSAVVRAPWKSKWHPVSTLGLVHCRRKAWQDAVDTLAMSGVFHPEGARAARIYYPVAMALHHLGRHADARLAFEFARRLIGLEVRMASDLRQELRLLHRETAAVLGDSRPPPDIIDG